ncbi:MAG: precorrin-3B C(17)-methyltransferase [Dehalococcoidia bacterium]|nr:precorrin-3B C(17)-methyltransferase [Dehalococcoidia bacterium]
MNAKIFLVGIGPGQAEHLTPRAKSVLERASVVIGHPDSLAQIAHLTCGKEVLALSQNPLERSRLAVERAQGGCDVAIISSGDPGTYAIGATFLDYLSRQELDIDVEVVPGIGLASYASARLGAALGADSASISLSDQNTPWDSIKRRLAAALSADFVLVIYNPLGKLGPSRWQEALGLIIQARHDSTPVGMLSQANSPDEKLHLATLGSLPDTLPSADTLIIIGNSQSYIRGGFMVTPRCYKESIGY